MRSSDRGQSDPAATRPESMSAGNAPAPTSAAADPYANWLERMQRARARHATITKNLYTGSNYKSWAERMKSSWDEDKNRKEWQE